MPRPTVFTKETLQKLEEVFALGGTDKEACFYADISPSSLYNYQNENPEFLERKHALQQNPILQARKTVINAVKKDPKIAFKYLEKKAPKEFGKTPYDLSDVKTFYITRYPQNGELSVSANMI